MGAGKLTRRYFGGVTKEIFNNTHSLNKGSGIKLVNLATLKIGGGHLSALIDSD